MSSDRETLAVYDAQADAYEARFSRMETPGFAEFVNLLPTGASVLDLGCGPGHNACGFIDAGLDVDAVDGSQEMVKLAAERGVPARQLLFSDLSGENLYDGVWANFSLLHLPRKDFAGALGSIHHALRRGGVFHIGMKLGEGSARDALGRFYTYYEQDELEDHLTNAGFTPIKRILGAGRGLDEAISNWIVVLSHG